jgi:hypothetical protein
MSQSRRLVQTLPGKPLKDVAGNRIGTIKKAWMDCGDVHVSAVLDADGSEITSCLFREPQRDVS